MVLVDRGSVVSKAGDPEDRAVTGEIGAGADVVRLTGGSADNLASIFPISFAWLSGVMREIRSASLGFEPR